MLVGFTAAFITALCKTGSDIAFKFASRRIAHDDVLLLAQRTVEAFLALALMAAAALFFSSPVHLPPGLSSLSYWGISILTATLNGLGLWLTIKALRISDVSLVSPMTQLTPLILLITSPLMLGEQLSPAGVLGVIGIVLGSYCMGLGTKSGGGLFASVTKLFSEKGVQFALLSSLVYGITSNLDKIGVLASSPLWWTAQQALLLVIPFYLFLRVAGGRARLALTPSQAGAAIIPGLTSGIGSIFQMLAIAVWPVPYVIAVKRLSSVFSVIGGVVFFKEQGFGWRIVGSMIMVACTALLLLYG